MVTPKISNKLVALSRTKSWDRDLVHGIVQNQLDMREHIVTKHSRVLS